MSVKERKREREKIENLGETNEGERFRERKEREAEMYQGKEK